MAVRRKQDVGRFHVAMDDAPVVDEREGIRDLPPEDARLAGTERSVAEPFGEARSGDQLHDVERVVSDLPSVVHAYESGMVECREGPHLPIEAGPGGRVVDPLHLDRDLTAESVVEGSEHDRHPAAAQDALHVVAVPQHLAWLDHRPIIDAAWTL